MSAEANGEIIRKFYTAFQNKDGKAMAEFYSPESTFRDEAFDLKHGDARYMWKMLTSRAKVFSLEFSNVVGTETGGSASWVATYQFGPKQRNVVNRINSVFRIENGLIVEHIDTFPFYTWAKQALGVVGWLFGWFPPFQNVVRKKAMADLKKYIEKHPDI